VDDDLARRILDHLRQRGPAKAKDIAAALGVERAAISQLLYGALRSQVKQDRSFVWSLVASPQAAPSIRPVVGANRWGSLFAYYLDCLAQDDDNGVSVLAESRYDPDYVELPSWPFDGVAQANDSDPLRKLVGRQRRDARRKILWLGYPVMLRQARSRGELVDRMVEPLLLWPQDPEALDFAFLPEPIVNTRAVRGAGPSDDILGEVALLAEELGLDARDSPPLDELVARLRDIRPEWQWKEPLVPAPLRPVGGLRRLMEPGIYNAAIVVIADRSPFTVGLERDLSELRTVSDSDIANSSLSVLLGKAGPHILDFALIRPNGRRLNIEVDGEHYHRDWDGELIRRDQLRNLRMIEMGWDVMRFWVYEVRDGLPACVNKVAAWAALADKQPALMSAATA
jgi:hypothetical protein